METKISWAGGATFIGESGDGHKIVMDGPPEGGGRNLGARPMETLLLGMGACTAYDVVSILQKSRQDIQDCTMTMSASRADEHPKVFTDIHIHFIVMGKGLKEKQVERAINLSAEKYCSASIMLGKTALITHDFEILESGE
ncbi:MAG: putative redox protein [Gammaproteobacteria bacterium]|jgi:putative redox protein